MILIYCPDLTSRKQYIFKHIFRRMLQVEYEVTGVLNVFVGHEGTKFSYGDKPLGEETFIWSNGLLSEHGIDDHEIDIMDWDQLPAFFQAPERSNFKGIQHVFFDLDHTLWDFDRNSKMAYSQIFEEEQLELDLEEFIAVYEPLNLKFWKRFRESEITKEQLRYQRL